MPRRPSRIQVQSELNHKLYRADLYELVVWSSTYGVLESLGSGVFGVTSCLLRFAHFMPRCTIMLPKLCYQRATTRYVGATRVPAWTVQRLHSCRVPRGTVMALLCAGPPIGTVRDISTYILHMQSTHGTCQILLYTSVYTLGTSLLCTATPEVPLSLVNIVQLVNFYSMSNSIYSSNIVL